MATRYVDFVNGLDANNGVGPDASHATDKPWKTLTKALGAAGIASGDTLYLSPAGPFRETTSIAMTSATAETLIIGDYANAQGFKTSGGVAVAPGPVIVTAYTTNDKTAPSATTLLNLAGRDFLTFKNIMFVIGNAIGVTASTLTSTDIKFTDCCFLGGRVGNFGAIVVTAAFATALNWTIDRCLFLIGNQYPIFFTLTRGTGADYDVNALVQNSFFMAAAVTGVRVISTGAGANFGGGVDVRNCTVFLSSMLQTADASLSTSIPCTVNNCFIYSANISGINAAAAGQITENYNLIAATTPRTNVTAGANSISDGSYAPLFHLGQERIWGGLPRNFGEPMTLSPLLGFGNDGTQTAYDLRNKLRPAGGESALPAAGAMGRSNTFTRETTTVRTGANAIGITGPGYQEFLVPVDDTSTTISVFVRWDATYAGTKPQLQIDANGEIGVTAETKTATGASGSWEQLTLTAFTPTAKGIVTVRVVSNDTNGGGRAFVDDFAVA